MLAAPENKRGAAEGSGSPRTGTGRVARHSLGAGLGLPGSFSTAQLRGQSHGRAWGRSASSVPTLSKTP